MAPFGPVPAMVGNETSFSAPVSRRKVSSASTVSISVSPPLGASRSIQARNCVSATASRRCAVRVPSISVEFLTALSRLTGSLPRTGLPPAAMIRRLSASAAVAPSSAIDAPALRQRVELRRQRLRLLDVGGLFEMIARAVGKLAVIDEHDGAAVLRHQRIGQRQRRMRDVGAADVEGPGHRMRIRQHQRFDPEARDLEPDPLELVGFRLAGELRAVNGDRSERRGRALGPHRIERIAVDRDQFRAGLGAGLGEPLGCRGSVQPRIKSEAVAGSQMLAPASFPAADRPGARPARPWHRPAWRPAAYSGRRRTQRPPGRARWPFRRIR